MSARLARVADAILVALVALFYRVLYATLRIEMHDPPDELNLERRHGAVFAHFHGDLLVFAGVCKGRGTAIMVSRSRDGGRIAGLLHHLGYRTIRGSRSRGGATALKEAIEFVRGDGHEAAFAVDGSKGPRHVVKPGVVRLAQHTGRKLVYGATAARRRIEFRKAWDRCYLPLPFTKCIVQWGVPMDVPEDLDDDGVERVRAALEAGLLDVKRRAEARLGRTEDDWA